LTHF